MQATMGDPCLTVPACTALLVQLSHQHFVRCMQATMKDPCLTVPACTAYIATKAAVKRSTLQTIIKALNRLRAIQRGLPAG